MNKTLQDPEISKPKKRKNQILYMNYILGEMEAKKKNSVSDLERTLLVTTDGDTSFKYKDIDALVDSIVSTLKIRKFVKKKDYCE